MGCANDARYTAVDVGVPPSSPVRTCGVHAQDFGASISDDKLPVLIMQVVRLLHVLDQQGVVADEERRAHIRGLLGVRSVTGCTKNECTIRMRCSYPTACVRPAGVL